MQLAMLSRRTIDDPEAYPCRQFFKHLETNALWWDMHYLHRSFSASAEAMMKPCKWFVWVQEKCSKWAKLADTAAHFHKPPRANDQAPTEEAESDGQPNNGNPVVDTAPLMLCTSLALVGFFWIGIEEQLIFVQAL